MARHETEMHRQRRILADALREIVQMAENRPVIRMPNGMMLGNFARQALFRAGQPDKVADAGLFSDRSQLDLADRPDLKR